MENQYKDNDFIPVAGAAAKINVSRGKMYYLIKRGLLPHFNFGGLLRVSRKDLNEFIRKSKRA